MKKDVANLVWEKLEGEQGDQTVNGISASEVTTIWRYTNVYIIIIIIL